MAGTIEFLQGAIKHAKTDWEKKFPAIEDVLVVHQSALEKLCPLYMQSYLDKSDQAFYLLARCNPLKGDCSRQMACAWLEDLFYDKCGCPSSYDVEAGGTMSRKVAISKELLPADNDAEYMDFYQEQMAKMKEMFAAEQKAAKKEEFIAKNGFDPDDPDIIDVDVDEPAKALPGDGTTSVEQSAGTAVGMPKPIWYGAVFHANGFGMKLGYDKKVWTLSQGNTTIDKLGFNPAGPQLTEKEEDEMVGEALNGGASVPQLFDDLLAAVGKGTPIWNDLMDIKDKYNLDAVTVGLKESTDECEKCGDDDCVDGEKCGLKESKNPYDDVDEETDAEIREIIDEDDDRSDSEKKISEYEKVEDDIDEEDDELSESVIRHATMLAREIW